MLSHILPSGIHLHIHWHPQPTPALFDSALFDLQPQPPRTVKPAARHRHPCHTGLQSPNIPRPLDDRDNQPSLPNIAVCRLRPPPCWVRLARLAPTPPKTSNYLVTRSHARQTLRPQLVLVRSTDTRTRLGKQDSAQNYARNSLQWTATSRPHHPRLRLWDLHKHRRSIVHP